MNVKYLNTDLEIESKEDLTPIVNGFGEDAFNLYSGEARGHYLATFEVNNSDTANGAIQYFCMLVNALDENERKLWDQSFSRVFDIGYEGGTNHSSYTDEIRPETLQMVASINASIRITVYPMPGEKNEKP